MDEWMSGGDGTGELTCVCTMLLAINRFLAKKKTKEKNRKMTEQERYEQEFQASGSTKKDHFDGAEKVRFGDRVDAPPVMPKLQGIFKKRAEQLQKKSQGKQQAQAHGGKRAAAPGGAGSARPAKKAKR